MSEEIKFTPLEEKAIEWFICQTIASKEPQGGLDYTYAMNEEVETGNIRKLALNNLSQVVNDYKNSTKENSQIVRREGLADFLFGYPGPTRKPWRLGL
jgi:Neuraminidase (sialidase)